MKEKKGKDSISEGVKDIYINVKKIKHVSEEADQEETERLDEAFQQHLEETENEIARLGQIKKKGK